MKINLKGRNFLTLKDFTQDEIIYLIDLASKFKNKKKKNIRHDKFRGKNIALIFEKTSFPSLISKFIPTSSLTSLTAP